MVGGCVLSSSRYAPAFPLLSTGLISQQDSQRAEIVFGIGIQGLRGGGGQCVFS